MADRLLIGLLQGGLSAEREISLLTAAAVGEALERAGHEIRRVDPVDHTGLGFVEALHGCDVVFIALHGGAGEDGRVQAALELAGLAYVGSRPGPSALAMDKIWSKRLARELGISTADFRSLPPGADDPSFRAAAKDLGWPLVMKPSAEGSAIGVHLVHTEAEFEAALHEQGPRDQAWMLERYVAGRELTIPILFEAVTSSVEIRPHEGWYDYSNKYEAGRTDYECPAPLPPAILAGVEADAISLYRALQLRDLARLDFRLDADGQWWLLEANTLPGMTSTSLLPMGAAAKGIDFDELCDQLVRVAAARGPARD